MPKPKKADTGSMGFQVRSANPKAAHVNKVSPTSLMNLHQKPASKVGDAHYSLKKPAQYSLSNNKKSDDVKFTDEEVGALARAIPNLFERWNLDDSQARKLLGGINQEKWDLWKKDADAVDIDDQDLKMRMAHLMGIHAGLLTIFNKPETGYAWINGADEKFGGKTALQVMLDGEIASIRKWIETEIRI